MAQARSLKSSKSRKKKRRTLQLGVAVEAFREGHCSQVHSSFMAWFEAQLSLGF